MKKIITSLMLLAVGTLTTLAQEESLTSEYVEKQMYTESQEGLLFSIGASYGMGFSGRYDYYNDWERDYRRKNNKGLALDMSLYYKLDNFNCIGFMYTNYSADMETSNVLAYAPGSEYDPIGITDVQNDINVSYYAFSYMVNFRIPESIKHELSLEQGMGYVHYHEDAYYPDHYEIKGGGIGFLTAFSYRYEIINNFVIGPRISFMTAIMFNQKVSGPNNYSATIRLLDDDRRSVNRLDLGISACYRF